MRSCDHQVPRASGPDYLKPKTERRWLQKNAKWLYFNGGRYWNGFYKSAVPKYSLAVLFSSFLMGEIAAATVFHQMAAACTEPVFKEAFRNIGKDEGRHMGICMSLMERDYPSSRGSTAAPSPSKSAPVTCSSRSPVRAPMEFWDPPQDFIANQREGEEIARGRLRHPGLRGEKEQPARCDPEPEGRARQVRHSVPGHP